MPGYVDTNVLIRLIVRDSASQARMAAQLIRDNSPVRLHSAIILETAFVLQHVYKRSRATIVQALRAILSSPRFLVDEAAVWSLTLDLYGATSLHLVDCHIAAKALTDGTALHTLDRDLDALMRHRTGSTS